MSGRNLDRYLAVLRTSRAVQDAFEEGRLTLALAAGVAGLPWGWQRRVAAAIADGEAPAGVVRAQLARSRNVRDPAEVAYCKLLLELKAAAGALGDDETLARMAFGDDGRLEALRAGRRLLKALFLKEREALAEVDEIA